MPTGAVTTKSGENLNYALYVDRYLQDTAVDMFSLADPLFAALDAGGGIRKWDGVEPWGKYLRVPIKWPAPNQPTVRGVSDPYTEVEPQPVTNLVDSVWEPCYLHVALAAEKRDIKRQKGKDAVLNFLNFMFEGGKDQWQEKLKEFLWAAEGATGAAGDGTHLASIRCLLNKGGTSSTGPQRPWVPADCYGAAADSAGGAGWTDAKHGIVFGSSPITKVGGIERNEANGAYFCVPVRNPSSAATFSRKLMNELATLGRNGKNHVTLFLVCAGHYDYLQDMAQGQGIGETGGALASYGFESLRFRNAEVVYAPEMDNIQGRTSTAFNILGINTKALGFYYPDKLAPDAQAAGHNARRPLKEWSMEGEYALVPIMLGRGLGVRHGNVAVA